MPFEMKVPRLHNALLVYCDHLSKLEFERAVEAISALQKERSDMISAWGGLIAPFVQLVTCEEMYCTMRYLDTAHGKTRSTQEMYRKLSRDLEVIQKAISLASQGNHASWEALMHRGVSDDVEETLPLDRSSASKHIKPSAPYIVAHGISLRHSAEMSPYVNLDYGHVLDVRLNAENLCHLLAGFLKLISLRLGMVEAYTRLQVTKRDGGFASERETLSGIQRLCGELSPYSQLRTVAAHILHEATCILSCLYAREAIFDCRYMDATVHLLQLDSELLRWLASYQLTSSLGFSQIQPRTRNHRRRLRSNSRVENISVQQTPTPEAWSWWKRVVSSISGNKITTADQIRPQDDEKVQEDEESSSDDESALPPAIRWIRKFQRRLGTKLHLCMSHVRYRALNGNGFNEDMEESPNRLLRRVDRGLKKAVVQTSASCVVGDLQYGYRCPVTSIELVAPKHVPWSSKHARQDKAVDHTSATASDRALPKIETMQHIINDFMALPTMEHLRIHPISGDDFVRRLPVKSLAQYPLTPHTTQPTLGSSRSSLVSNASTPSGMAFRNSEHGPLTLELPNEANKPASPRPLAAAYQLSNDEVGVEEFATAYADFSSTALQDDARASYPSEASLENPHPRDRLSQTERDNFDVDEWIPVFFKSKVFNSTVTPAGCCRRESLSRASTVQPSVLASQSARVPFSRPGTHSSCSPTGTSADTGSFDPNESRLDEAARLWKREWFFEFFSTIISLLSNRELALEDGSSHGTVTSYQTKILSHAEKGKAAFVYTNVQRGMYAVALATEPKKQCEQELRELVGLIASELRDDAVFDALNSVRLDDE